jgi:putative oxidoreductase
MIAMAEVAAAAPSRSILAKLVAVCAAILYALIALFLRFVMARVFFLSGQAKIDGPRIPVRTDFFEFSVTLPAAIKDSTFEMFDTQYANLPIPATVAAIVFTYAEFVLPICLLLGFGARLAALGLLVMTVLLQVYVVPGMWWPAHVYWVSILLVLIVLGPGAISIDALIRRIYLRDRRAP